MRNSKQTKVEGGISEKNTRLTMYTPNVCYIISLKKKNHHALDTNRFLLTAFVAVQVLPDRSRDFLRPDKEHNAIQR